MDAVNQKNNTNKKLSKVLSTKLSIEDYNSFRILTKLEYKAGLIKEESTSELLRFTIRHILKQAHNQPEYLILKQEQHQNNHQQHQLHNQVIPPSTTAPASHQHQVSSIYRRNNLIGQKIIQSSMQTGQPYSKILL
jgi:transcription initiation factor TFIID subunit TAF12